MANDLPVGRPTPRKAQWWREFLEAKCHPVRPTAWRIRGGIRSPFRLMFLWETKPLVEAARTRFALPCVPIFLRFFARLEFSDVLCEFNSVALDNGPSGER